MSFKVGDIVELIDKFNEVDLLPVPLGARARVVSEEQPFALLIEIEWFKTEPGKRKRQSFFTRRFKLATATKTTIIYKDRFSLIELE